MHHMHKKMRLTCLFALCIAVVLGGNGTGCQKKIGEVCTDQYDPQRGNLTACKACVAAHAQQLEPNCTAARAEKKCDMQFPPTPPPAPPTPAPPTPAPTPPDPSAPRPHIVLFAVDDQGWANVGYHNPGNVHTPHMDSLSADGVRLERHYTYRWCAPTRSALMTGRLPYHVLQNTNYVHRDMSMLPAKLKAAGYSTAQVGKW